MIVRKGLDSIEGGKRENRLKKRGHETFLDSVEKLYLEDIRDIQLLKIMTGHSDFVHSVAFSRNGEYIASGSNDCTIGLWRVSSGERIKTLTDHSAAVASVVFSRDGEYLASGSADTTIGLWRVSSGERIKTLTGHSAWI